MDLYLQLKDFTESDHFPSRLRCEVCGIFSKLDEVRSVFVVSLLRKFYTKFI